MTEYRLNHAEVLGDLVDVGTCGAAEVVRRQFAGDVHFLAQRCEGVSRIANADAAQLRQLSNERRRVAGVGESEQACQFVRDRQRLRHSELCDERDLPSLRVVVFRGDAGSRSASQRHIGTQEYPAT